MDTIRLSYTESFINGLVGFECLIVPDIKNSKYIYYLRGRTPRFSTCLQDEKYIDMTLDPPEMFHDCSNNKYFSCPGRVMDKAVSLMHNLAKLMGITVDIQFYETEVDYDPCTVLYITLIPF